jgi:D-serine deaminase-like pyridoxal phosphate-dependent protein
MSRLFPELDTPAVLIDLDVVEQNLARMQRIASNAGVRLRPHTKTHKSRYFARRQLQHGAAGLTVAKLGEAEVLSEVCDDLLVAYPLYGAQKLRRLGALAGRLRRLRVSTDSLEVAQGYSALGEELGRPLEVYLEVDVGYGRLGQPPDEHSEQLARAIGALPGLQLVGVMTHGGFAYAGRTPEQLRASAVAEGAALVALAARLREQGLPISEVSVGSSPSAPYVDAVPGVTELRPGTYIFNDLQQIATGAVTPAQCAASVLVTVVSRPAPDRAIVDGGSKTFTNDQAPQGGNGRALDRPGLWLERLSEEHGWLRIDDPATPLAIGDRLRFTPNHVCAMINLHDRVYGVRGNELVEEISVDARGRIR